MAAQRRAVTRLVWLVAAGVLFSACGAPEAPAVIPAPQDHAGRQRIIDFWRVYGAATDLRVAGDVAGARARYDSALALNPNHGDALYHAGAAAFQLQDFAAAESHWRHLLAVDGSNARAHAQLGVLYSCGLPGAPVDLGRARLELERALNLNRAETGPQVQLGEIFLLLDQPTEAGRHFEAVRRTNERSVAAHYLAGYLHWRAGRQAAALAALQQAATAGGDGRKDPSASAEGQTRLGFRPLLESGIEGPLTRYWQPMLQQLSTVNDSTMHAEYERFDRVLGPARQALTQQETRERGDTP